MVVTWWIVAFCVVRASGDDLTLQIHMTPFVLPFWSEIKNCGFIEGCPFEHMLYAIIKNIRTIWVTPKAHKDFDFEFIFLQFPLTVDISSHINQIRSGITW